MEKSKLISLITWHRWLLSQSYSPAPPSPAELCTLPSTSSALQADELVALFNLTKLDEDHIDLAVMKPCIEHEGSTETFLWVD